MNYSKRFQVALAMIGVMVLISTMIPYFSLIVIGVVGYILWKKQEL